MVTRPFLNLLVEPRIFFRFSECIKLHPPPPPPPKKSVATLPKFFRRITRNTLIFLFGLSVIKQYYMTPDKVPPVRSKQIHAEPSWIIDLLR